MWNEARRDDLRTKLAGVVPYGRPTAQSTVAAIDAWRDDWVGAHTATCRATRVSGQQSEDVMALRMQCLDRRLHEMDALVSELAVAGPRAEHALAAVRQITPIAECADVDRLSGVTPIAGEDAERIERLYQLIDSTRARARLGDRTAGRDAEALVDLGDDYPAVRADALLAAAEARRVSGDIDTSLDHANNALWLAQKSKAAHLEARAWQAIVAAHAARGAFDRALETAGHARAAVDRLGSPPGMEQSLMRLLGIIYTNLGQYELADQALARTSELDERLRGAVDSRTLTAIGNLRRSQKRYREAIKAHEDAGRADEEELGKRHPRIGRHYHNIAGIYRLMGKPEQAIPRYETALALERETFGPGHPETALTINSLGLVHLDKGEMAEAEALFREALRIFEANDHEDRAVAMHNLALTRIEADPSEALDLLTRAEALYSRTYPDGHERLVRVRQARAKAEAALGKNKRGANNKPKPKPKPRPPTNPDSVYMPSQNVDP